jgi:methenyltetrahydromethanopterin cyclohydrolase
MSEPSVNRLAAPLVRQLIDDAAALRIKVEPGPLGCRVVDGGIDCHGGIEAGRRIAEICMGGLGQVAIAGAGAIAAWPLSIEARSSHPVLACLGSQYAGWQLAAGEGMGAFFALGSGPGRALVRKEPLFEELGYRDDGDRTCLVLETGQRPPAALVEKVSANCGIKPEQLTLILTPTQSLAGTVQIVARVLEVALHKLHEIRFPLERVVDGMGSAPLPPPGGDFVAAMGRTNDAIIYGGFVHLFVRGPDDEACQLASDLPSGGSRDFGRPFAELFKSYKGDFYAMDRLLFSPAQVTITALESGRSFRGGQLDPAMIDRSFGGG